MTKSAHTIIRPVAMDDLEALYRLTCMASGGLSSLQPDRDYLANYIQSSLDSFAGVRPAGKGSKYFLVAETDDVVIGCAAVKTRIGNEASPFINFDISSDGKFLTASDRFAGATEVGSLFLHPDHRRSGIGRYLAKARYLLIAAQPERFSQTIIAELRGISRDDDAPFYDAVFKARLGHSFLDADHLYATTQAAALALVPPDDPIAISDLPALARRAIGRPHPSGQGALTLLEREGFADTQTIDLFDGGPIVAAYRDKLATLNDSQMLRVEAGDPQDGDMHLLARNSVEQFRAVVCVAEKQGRKLSVSGAALDSLGAPEAMRVRVWSKAMEAAHV